jgi:hypothetical protein
MMLKPSCGVERYLKLEAEFRPYIDREKHYDSLFEWELVKEAPENAIKALDEFKSVSKKDFEESERYRKMGFC